MTFSKFDTQIQIEETDYEPTAADLAELDVWLDEVEADISELEDYDMRSQESEDEWHDEVNAMLDADGDIW